MAEGRNKSLYKSWHGEPYASHLNDKTHTVNEKGNKNQQLNKYPSLKNFDGSLTIHEAAAQGNAKVLTLLLDKGINPNSILEDGTTPLHEAASQGHDNLVKILLQVISFRISFKK